MTPAPRFRVALFSRAPHEHHAVIESFRRSGAAVQIASSPAQALAVLRRAPELVLVDLAHGACLNPAVVRILNRDHSATLVVALHEGGLEHVADDARHLSVHGFCRSVDLVERPQMLTAAALPGSHAVH
jgi:DNA-binding NtrC family response regulator